jgi:oligopeptide transport system substrate-binding protein
MRTRKFTWSALVLTIGTLAVLLAGCGGSSGGSGPVADDKQILRSALVPNKIDIRRLDPAKITDLYSFTAALLIFPGLVTLDSKLNVVPWAADMPTVTDGGLTYTFKIHSGIKWSDGTPIDANTFAYSLNRSLDPCTASGAASYLYPIKGAAAFNSGTCPKTANANNPVSTTTLVGSSIVVSDPQTLVVTLEKPYAYFLDTLVTSVAFAQPKQLITQYGVAKWTDHLTDNGGFGGNLFNVKVWDHQGKLNLVRNDGFWGTKPKLKEIDFKIYKDADTAYNDYKNGQLDRAAPPPSQYKQASTRSDFHAVPYLAISYLQPNWKKAPFNDVNARQAFALSLNKDAIANQVLKGAEIPTNHIVPQGQFGYDPQLTGPDGTNNLTGNPTKAKELITTYAQAHCGGDITKCTPVDYFTDDTPDATAQSQAELAQWQAAMPGYPIHVHNIAFNDLIDKTYSGDAPQLVGIGWIVDYPDPEDWLSLQFLPGSSTNTGNVNDPIATDLMNKGDVEQNPATRLQLSNQAEQELVNQGAWIPEYQQKGYWVASSHVSGFAEASSGYPVLDTWQKVFLTQ